MTISKGCSWVVCRGPVRNKKALDRIRAYIANNPAQWAVTLTISRERRLPREGGFETRPYKSPDCALRREEGRLEIRGVARV